MGITIPALFKFENFKIRKSCFEINQEDEGQTISIKFFPKGIIYKKEQRFELELGVILEDENKNFKAEIIAVGTFTFDSKIQPDDLNKYFITNAPAIIFPYIRAYLSTLTTLSGYKPINLPTLNLANLGPELKENIKEV